MIILIMLKNDIKINNYISNNNDNEKIKVVVVVVILSIIVNINSDKYCDDNNSITNSHNSNNICIFAKAHISNNISYCSCRFA